MKKNQNDRNPGYYYLGLDVGTSSVGWAVTDPEYNLLKYRGNAMWGVRLFDEANSAAERRSSRTARRRLARSKQRLLLLEALFAPVLVSVDPHFLSRMHESDLWIDEKKYGYFSLFNDPDYTDREYHKAFPTVYHLRSELCRSSEPHDIRLVYLAIHHIMKSRGHFLYETSDMGDSIPTVQDTLNQFSMFIKENYGQIWEPQKKDTYISVLQKSTLGVSEKKKILKEALGVQEEGEWNPVAISDLLSGASVTLDKLLTNEESHSASNVCEIKSICLKNDLEEQYDVLSSCLGDHIELLLQAKTVYDVARLTQILDGCNSISDAKIAQYQKNHRDLHLLKKYIRAVAPDMYKTVFSGKKDKLNNYPAYSQYPSESGEYTCKQEDFCKYLKSILPKQAPTQEEFLPIHAMITDGTLLPRLRSSDNGVIPYQLHRAELKKILVNASGYLPFLSEKDSDGLTVADKILKTFEFRLPYYVGPISTVPGCTNHWAVRFSGHENDRVFPWNFDQIIDLEKSADTFMSNLIERCTYTGEPVLPKDSLLYSEYALLNEINPLKINGHPLPAKVKSQLINDLFRNSAKKVTKRRLADYLLQNDYMSPGDELTGIDDSIKTVLKSYHDFALILAKTGDTGVVEDIIRSILVFGDDKTMLRRWLKKNVQGLNENDIKYVCRLKYAGWGRFSRVFLEDIYHEEDTGEVKSIMDYMRNTDKNLMQLMSGEYQFSAKAEAYRSELFGINRSLTDRLNDLYIAPAVRRSLRQTLRIVDEIVDIRKSVPQKIFIEMARDSKEEMKGKRTESRKDKLIALYQSCNQDQNALLEQLNAEDENKLRSDALYLYYTQFGRCMYSGEIIDLDRLSSDYDIDHIFPRSRIKDDSLDNRVLVKKTLNHDKSNIYPIESEIRNCMRAFWSVLKDKGLISSKKYERLTRSTPLSDDELSSFVARQLTETQQSTKALAALLKERYGDNTIIIYSKAGNVSGFRHQFDLIKYRDVNDLHHAKDAYLNIVVGNVYATRFTDRFFLNIRNENYSLNNVFDSDTAGAWKKDETIHTVKRIMAKGNVIVTRMPYMAKGALFDLQLMPAGKGQLEAKQGRDIARYGGYNKITGSYFCVAEYTEKKKRIRAILPVFLYCRSIYENNPVQYCKEILHLQDPIIIAPEIRVGSLLELNQQRLLIASRTGDAIRFKHTYQLVIDYESEKYIKDLTKYMERCAARKQVLPISEKDGLSVDKNLSVYDLLVDKCKKSVYIEFTKNMVTELENKRDAFRVLSILDQAKQIHEILKFFHTDAQIASLELIGGVKSAAIISKNKVISSLDSACLINQSITGLYETRVDLLGEENK